MSVNAARSIDEYLKQLRGALAEEDPALTQDARYDTEEYLRAEVASHPGVRRIFGVFVDTRPYTSLFYMLLTLATGIVYFTLVVTGLALSAGLAILVIGIPFFLAFIGMARVLALGEVHLRPAPRALAGGRARRAFRLAPTRALLQHH
jgi:hypothetical protein